ncbi:MAG: hypothetical protein AAFY10_01080 [Pseudomonadota bacterium]
MADLLMALTVAQPDWVDGQAERGEAVFGQVGEVVQQSSQYGIEWWQALVIILAFRFAPRLAIIADREHGLFTRWREKKWGLGSDPD